MKTLEYLILQEFAKFQNENTIEGYNDFQKNYFITEISKGMLIYLQFILIYSKYYINIEWFLMISKSKW